MWIDRKTYDDLRLDAAKNNTECRVLSEQNRALQTSLDWFRVRISQLEHERAQLLYNFTGVKVATPQIERVSEKDTPGILHAVQSFQDMGNEEAARQGIGWNPDGTLTGANKEK